MTAVDVTLQDRHRDQLVHLLDRPDGSEAAAYALFGEASVASSPWYQHQSRRLSSHSVERVPQRDIVSADGRHVTWSTQSFVELCRRAKAEGLVPGVVHSHPGGTAAFSKQDDRNERDLYQLARNRNGDGTALASLLLIGGEDFRARLWVDANRAIPAQAVISVGGGVRFYCDEVVASGELWDRQARALGSALNPVLNRLRVGIVGCGGTGSATAMQLARLGVGHIALIDQDVVEESNLNRLHGARLTDVGEPKTDVISREITAMETGIQVSALRCWVDDPAARDVLRSCDVIFGCTDDHAGRLLLNRFAYYYLRPVIDMGLAIEPRSGGGLADATARVTVLVPGTPCLVCRGVVDGVVARDETLVRRCPDEYARQEREGYVRGLGDPAPAVVTFTTETACMAVNELLQGLIDFRRDGSWKEQRSRRLDRSYERVQGERENPACPVCGNQTCWGRGDVEPFLNRVP